MNSFICLIAFALILLSNSSAEANLAHKSLGSDYKKFKSEKQHKKKKESLTQKQKSNTTLNQNNIEEKKPKVETLTNSTVSDQDILSQIKVEPSIGYLRSDRSEQSGAAKTSTNGTNTVPTLHLNLGYRFGDNKNFEAQFGGFWGYTWASGGFGFDPMWRAYLGGAIKEIASWSWGSFGAALVFDRFEYSQATTKLFNPSQVLQLRSVITYNFEPTIYLDTKILNKSIRVSASGVRTIYGYSRTGDGGSTIKAGGWGGKLGLKTYWTQKFFTDVSGFSYLLNKDLKITFLGGEVQFGITLQ